MTAPLAHTSLRCLVVEDEWPARNYLVESLAAMGADVVAAVATLAEAEQALAPGGIAVDVAFVDIHLASSGDTDAGMTLVRALAGQPGAPAFVIATAFAEHAVEAYALGVTDYLLKPFSEERVKQCLTRLRARLPLPTQRPVQRRVVARTKKGLVFLRTEETWAFEAADRLTFVHTPHGRYDVDLSLAALESSTGERFMRVHRNWLVNVDQVRALEREDGDTEVLLGAGLDDSQPTVRVPVAREKAQAVKELLLVGTTGLRRP
jgi:two-component system, LytTR family, response regulator LytT